MKISAPILQHCFIFTSLTLIMFACNNYQKIEKELFSESTEIIISAYTSKYASARTQHNDPSLLDVNNLHQITLNKQQKKQLFGLLYQNNCYVEAAKCYNPKHLISFYKFKQRIGFIEICFECNSNIQNGLSSKPIGNPACGAVSEFFTRIGLKKPNY